MQQLRSELGDFANISQLKSIVFGLEAALGEKTAAVALTSAGRNRGREDAATLGYRVGQYEPQQTQELTTAVNRVVGLEGSRLCKIARIDLEGSTLQVHTTETVCSAGEPAGASRKCTYTLGVVHGIVEFLTGRKYFATQTASVLRGGEFDTFTLAARD
jgi:hypothetical protein